MLIEASHAGVLPPEVLVDALVNDSRKTAIVWEIPKDDSRFVLPKLDEIQPLPWIAEIDFSNKIIKRGVKNNKKLIGPPPSCDCGTPDKCAKAGGYDMVIVGESGSWALKHPFVKFFELDGGKAEWTQFNTIVDGNDGMFSGWGCRLTDPDTGKYYIFWLGPDRWSYDDQNDSQTSDNEEVIIVSDDEKADSGQTAFSMDQQRSDNSLVFNVPVNSNNQDPYKSIQLIEQIQKQNDGCVEFLEIRGVHPMIEQDTEVVSLSGIELLNVSDCAWVLDPASIDMVVEGLSGDFTYKFNFDKSMLPGETGRGTLTIYGSKTEPADKVVGIVEISSSDGRVVIGGSVPVSFFNQIGINMENKTENYQDGLSAPKSNLVDYVKSNEDELTNTVAIIGVSTVALLVLMALASGRGDRNQNVDRTVLRRSTGGGQRRDGGGGRLTLPQNTYTVGVTGGVVNQKDVDKMRDDLSRGADKRVATIEEEAKRKVEEKKAQLGKQYQEQLEKDRVALEVQAGQNIAQINKRSNARLTAEEKKLKAEYEKQRKLLTEGFTKMKKEKQKELDDKEKALVKKEQELADEQQRLQKLADEMEAKINTASNMLAGASVSEVAQNKPLISEIGNKPEEPVDQPRSTGEETLECSEPPKGNVGRVLDSEHGIVSIPSSYRRRSSRKPIDNN